MIGKSVLTITMIVRNEEKHMSKAIESLLCQTYFHFTLMIVNNGSTDSTGEIADRYAKQDYRVTVIHENKNDPAIFRKIIELVHTQYFMFAAGHDFYAPTFIEKCVAVLEKDPHVVLAYPRASWFKENKIIAEIPGVFDTRKMDSFTRALVVAYGLVEAYQYYGVYRFDAFKSLGCHQVIGPDHVQLTELAILGSFALIDEPLFFLRMADDWGDWEVYRKKHLPESSYGVTAYLKMICAYMSIAERISEPHSRMLLKNAFFTMCLLRHGSLLNIFGESRETLMELPEFRELTNHLTEAMANIEQDLFIKYAVSQPNKKVCISLPLDKGTKPPLIIIDGIFFQFMNTGIARLWSSLLREWAKTDFASSVLFLDRAGTGPKIAGIRSKIIPAYNYDATDNDRSMLQAVCDEEKADLFVSTYYTTPLTTPSVFYTYDMIPENTPFFDLNTPSWREKHYGIMHAVAYIAISRYTAMDLVKAYPPAENKVTVAYPAVDTAVFASALDCDVEQFRTKYGITRPYLLFVGQRLNYKNAKLLFEGLALVKDNTNLDIVCVGGLPTLEPFLSQLIPNSTVHILRLGDNELRLAYSGAVAFVYPSIYEGFGLPVLEAMACGCPVITCQNSSIFEAAGAAALYVAPDSPDEMAAAIQHIQQPDIRAHLITLGKRQIRKFSWSKMADEVREALLKTYKSIERT